MGISKMSRDDLYRILTPSEFQAMKDAPLPNHFKISTQQRNMWLDVMMSTGMRYKELLILDANWEWFDSKNNAITLPKEFTKTKKDRTVHLTPAFSKGLAQYLHEFKTVELPTINVMNANLRRWSKATFWENGKETFPYGYYPTVKTFRKSWESWLLMADYSIHKVALSQGHTVAVSEHHYANLSASLKSEVEAIKKLTNGWHT